MDLLRFLAFIIAVVLVLAVVWIVASHFLPQWIAVVLILVCVIAFLAWSGRFRGGPF